jgi:hypothetical protein
VLGFWHLTSLDAPTVAVIWCVAFAHVTRVELPQWIPLVLGLATWAFYIADRLLDAHKSLRLSPTEQTLHPLRLRHHFHWKHRRFFLPVAVAAALAALLLVLHSMPAAARQRNSLLAAAALAYFSSVHAPGHFPLSRMRRALKIPKELLVGIIFTAACAIPAWSRMSGNRLSFLPIYLVFAALAWLNCQAIEAWENNPPQGDLSDPKSRIAPTSFLLALTAMALATILLFLHPQFAALFATAAISALSLALLDRYRHRLESLTLRSAADLILLTPVILLLLP